jgi:hypothetical protein
VREPRTANCERAASRIPRGRFPQAAFRKPAFRFHTPQAARFVDGRVLVDAHRRSSALPLHRERCASDVTSLASATISSCRS